MPGNSDIVHLTGDDDINLFQPKNKATGRSACLSGVQTDNLHIYISLCILTTRTASMGAMNM
jgi:hypothetical protein